MCVIVGDRFCHVYFFFAKILFTIQFIFLLKIYFETHFDISAWGTYLRREVRTEDLA